MSFASCVCHRMITFVVCRLWGISERCDQHTFPLRSYRSSHQRDPSVGKVQGFEQHHFRPEPAALKLCEVFLAASSFIGVVCLSASCLQMAEINCIGMSKINSWSSKNSLIVYSVKFHWPTAKGSAVQVSLSLFEKWFAWRLLPSRTAEQWIFLNHDSGFTSESHWLCEGQSGVFWQSESQSLWDFTASGPGQQIPSNTFGIGRMRG